MTRDKTAYQFLTNLARRLQDNGIALPNQSGDGRVDSQANESLVIDAAEKATAAIAQQMGLEVKFLRGKERHWYDLALVITCQDGPYLVPVNVKISGMKAPDNLSAKLGLLYALTGKEPQAKNLNWDDFHTTLVDMMGAQEDADYYFLVVQKDSDWSGRVLAQSLKRLKKIVPNGSNLPFQCKWSDNLTPVERSFDEARIFLTGALGASHRLRAAALVSFDKHFPDLRNAWDSSHD